MEYSFIIGILGSISASIIFLIAAYAFLRPKLAISKQIARRKDSNDIDLYTFKIINQTRWPLIDIKVQISLYTPRNVSNGQITQEDILKSFDRFELDAVQNKNEPFDNEAWYTINKLEDIWNDENQFISINVSARHSLSQFSKVFTQRYHRKKVVIINGQFANGSSLEVVKES